MHQNTIENIPHTDCNHHKHEFIKCEQMHAMDKITNTMKMCVIGGAILSPNSVLERFNFMSLEDGAQFNGKVTDILPITADCM